MQSSPADCSANRRISVLDGWRGIAILAVIVSLVASITVRPDRVPWVLSLGQQGVTLFFVISGYIITRRLGQEYAASGSINLRSFYVRRAFRILPCSLIYLTSLGLLHMSDHLAPVLLFYRNYT